MIFCFAYLTPKPAAAESLKSFAGRWVGNGQIIFTNKTKEKIFCRVTYFVRNSGNRLDQNIRCKSASGVKFEVKSKLNRQGGSLKGNWQETNYNQKGSLRGQWLNNGFNLIVKSQTGAASMKVRKSGNRQNVILTGDGEIVNRVTILLVKG